MSDFKVVFRSDSSTKGERALTWEPGCPLAFEAVQVARNVKTGKAYLQVKVRNIGAGLIESFKATFRVVSKDGQTETAETSLLDADIAPGGSFSLPPRLLETSDVTSVVCRIESASTAHATWASKGEPAPVPTPPCVCLVRRGGQGAMQDSLGRECNATSRREVAAVRKAKDDCGGGLVGLSLRQCECGAVRLFLLRCIA